MTQWDELPALTSKSELEAYGVPSAAARDKTLSKLEQPHHAWIAACPLVLIATSSADGRCDVSPKGDPAGFIRVLDDVTIAIPERPGNRRYDSFHNVIQNPHVGLELVIPGRADTLRINGTARIVTAGPFFAEMTVAGHLPRLVLLVTVEEIFFHCPKAFMRSACWEPATWAPDRVEKYAQLAKQLWRKGDDPADVDRHYDPVRYRASLYTE